jgi:hypothetical protein
VCLTKSEKEYVKDYSEELKKTKTEVSLNQISDSLK